MRGVFWGLPAVSALVFAACGYGDYAELFGSSGAAKPSGDASAAAGGAKGTGGSSSTGGSVSSSGGSNNTGGSNAAGGSNDTGGSSDTGGSAGTGGGTVEAVEMIDDMEQSADAGTSDLPRTGGRTGGWFTFNDGTFGGRQDPQNGRFTFYEIVPARSDSHWSARTYGNGFTRWGAQLGINLMNPAAPYDASRFTGVRFWARVGQGAMPGYTISFREARTAPPSGGGTCTANCYHDFAKGFTVTTSWQQIRILFADAAQDTPVLSGLDSSKLITILFNIGASTTFDLWVDDLAFICKNASCQ